MLRRLWHSPTATTWGSLAVRLAAVVIVLPFVLVRFAPPEVAVWQLFSTMFMLALMMDFGLAPTFTRLLSYARGGASVGEMLRMRASEGSGRRPPNTESAALVMSALRWLYPRMALGVTLLLAVLGTLGLLRPIAQTADTTQAWIAWSLVLATTGLTLWGGSYAAALQGMDKVAVMRRWEVATGLGQVASSIAVVALGGSLLALVAAYQSWAVVGALRSRWLLRRLHPELFAQAAAPHPEVMRVMWPSAWRSGVGVLMSAGVIQASGIIYSQLAPATEVAAYLLALRLMTVISQFCQAPYYSKLPRLAQLQATGQQPEQLLLAQHGMRIAYWVFVAGALAVSFGAEPLLGLIGSRTGFVPAGVWALMALAFFAERFGAMHLQLYSLTNHIVWHIANGVTGVAMIAIAAAAYPRIGSYAFPAAMLIAYAGFYAVYAVFNSRRAYQFNLWRFERGISVPPAMTLVALLGLAGLVRLHLAA